MSIFLRFMQIIGCRVYNQVYLCTCFSCLLLVLPTGPMQRVGLSASTKS